MNIEKIKGCADQLLRVSKLNSVSLAMCSLALSMLLSSFGVSVANIALPALTQVFNVSIQTVQWVVLAYLLALTIVIVSVGRLGDIIGRRTLLIAGIILFTLASFFCGVAPTLWMLIAARALQGIGAAILMTITVALVRDTMPKEKTGMAMGLLGTMSAIGTAFGPSLGGMLIAAFDWRAIFFIMVPLGLLNLFLIRRYLPIPQQKVKIDRSAFDIIGTLLLGITLAAYALAATVGGGRFDQSNFMLLLAAIFGGALFVYVETKVSSPLIQLAVFRNVTLSASLIVNALVSTVMMTTLVVGPFYLSWALGLSAVLVGVVISIGPTISVVSGFPAGRMVDRFGTSSIVVIGLMLMVCGTAALSLLPSIFGLVGYIVAIAVLTPGYQLFQAANNTAVMMDVSTDQRGVISGLLSLSRSLGLITGASVMGALFALASMTSDIATAHPHAVATGMQITFAVAGFLIIGALGIAMVGVHMSSTRS